MADIGKMIIGLAVGVYITAYVMPVLKQLSTLKAMSNFSYGRREHHRLGSWKYSPLGSSTDYPYNCNNRPLLQDYQRIDQKEVSKTSFPQIFYR